MSRLNKRIDKQLEETDQVTGKKKKRKSRSFPPKTKAQAQLIFDAIWKKNPILSLCCQMSGLTGLRYSDASWLMRSDFYDKYGNFKESFEICQQKTYNMRVGAKNSTISQSDAYNKSLVTIYTNPEIREIVEDCEVFTGHTDLLFANKKSRTIDENGQVLERPMSVYSASHIHTKVQDELKLEFELGTHSWRKFFTLMLVRDLTSVEKIRDLLGQKDLKSTNEYLHTFSDELMPIIQKLTLSDK